VPNDDDDGGGDDDYDDDVFKDVKQYCFKNPFHFLTKRKNFNTLNTCNTVVQYIINTVYLNFVWRSG